MSTDQNAIEVYNPEGRLCVTIPNDWNVVFPRDPEKEKEQAQKAFIHQVATLVTERINNEDLNRFNMGMGIASDILGLIDGNDILPPIDLSYNLEFEFKHPLDKTNFTEDVFNKNISLKDLFIKEMERIAES